MVRVKGSRLAQRRHESKGSDTTPDPAEWDPITFMLWAAPTDPSCPFTDWGREFEQHTVGPERWCETMHGQTRPRGKTLGGGCRRAVLTCKSTSDPGIGAERLTNHLVAGPFRSFPQDSWRSRNQFYPVKRYVLELGGRNASTYSNFKWVRSPPCID
ncbi:hypothetical protein HNY73_011682 [Argiope bruennichi]|uniref:Uncharacterized protein n=1 Tax=Argiope bruennichi TaxID=94029 RepID=A0A8T0EYZ8_ARGBR|nr:hypothetical protein HNY73_011682 [Argiope bruennichi]